MGDIYCMDHSLNMTIVYGYSRFVWCNGKSIKYGVKQLIE